eukprot:3932778-Rhodomonas_salina.2
MASKSTDHCKLELLTSARSLCWCRGLAVVQVVHSPPPIHVEHAGDDAGNGGRAPVAVAGGEKHLGPAAEKHLGDHRVELVRGARVEEVLEEHCAPVHQRAQRLAVRGRPRVGGDEDGGDLRLVDHLVDQTRHVGWL